MMKHIATTLMAYYAYHGFYQMSMNCMRLLHSYLKFQIYVVRDVINGTGAATDVALDNLALRNIIF